MIVVSLDPIAYVENLTRKAIGSTSSLSGFRHGTKIPAAAKPRRYIRYDLVGGGDEQRVGDRVEVRFQVYASDAPERERLECARILLAHLRAAAARKTSGPISLPDPADPMQSITQFTVSLLLIGTQQ